MSETTAQANYSHYDEMPSEQLSEILRKHAHDELEVEPDIEELLYIMEVLSEREKANPNTRMKSPEEAFESFVKHYAPEMAREKHIRFPRVIPQWAKRAAVVAVVFISLAAAAVSADAFAPGFWDKIASWTREVFYFEEYGQTQDQTPDKENLELVSLQEALAQYNITQSVMPSWLPDGYVAVDLRTSRTPKEVTISAVYEYNGERLIVKIRQVIGSTPQKIEKSEELVETYRHNDVDYYILTNNDALQAAWVVDDCECLVIGKLTLEQMKQLIDSIH